MKKLLYLLEFGPYNEQILEQISVQKVVEESIYQYAQKSGLELDSVDIVSDFIAITFYLDMNLEVDEVVQAIKRYSHNALLSSNPQFKNVLVDGMLWQEGYTIEIL